MNVLYAKSILYAYPNIEAIADQIDDLVEKKALASMTDFSPAVEQCQKIIDLTEQKVELFKLQILVEKILKSFTEDEMHCLDYKYFKRKPKDYYQGFDTSSRNYFRKQNRIVKKFIDKLEKNKFDDNAFESRLLTMDFFVQLLKRVKYHEEISNKNKGGKKVEKQKGVGVKPAELTQSA